MKPLKVLFVTSQNEHCGIREYGEYLLAELKAFPDLEVIPHFDPNAHQLGTPEVDIIHVSHQAALHSSWREAEVKEYQKNGYIVCVTQHDTFETWEIMLDRGMPNFLHADGLILHEPVKGLMEGWKGKELVEYFPGPKAENVPYYQDVEWVHKNVHYFQQGVLPETNSNGWIAKKTLGTVGFDFPWKNFELGAKYTAEAGWVYLVISPGMKQERVNAIKAINPDSIVVTPWLNAQEVVHELSACTATAFLYVTGNSGTSGAIRMGIGARRPVIAFCSRQNRDLAMEKSIDWLKNDAHIGELLEQYGKGEGIEERIAGVKKLAERDSWKNLAQRYHDMWWKCAEDRG
jgi:glycosyltransferase involved in cell wall biosynthesis